MNKILHGLKRKQLLIFTLLLENKCLFKTESLYHANNASQDQLCYGQTSLILSVTKSGLSFVYLIDFSNSYNSRTKCANAFRIY